MKYNAFLHISALVLAVLFGGSTIVSATTSPTSRAVALSSNLEQESQDAILTLKYRTTVNTTINAIFVGDTVYLPVTEIFYQLGINSKGFNKNANVIGGFYLRKTNDYELDFASLTARVGNMSSTINPDEFIVTQVDVYCQPSLFERIFKLKLIVSFKDLTVYVTSTQQLPVDEVEQLELLRQTLSDSTVLQESFFPIIAGRNRSLLDGGAFGYNLVFGYDNLRSRTNVGFLGSLGAEVLGGDFTGLSSLGYANSNSNISQVSYQNLYRWRYVFTEDATGNALASALSVGNFLPLQSSGGFYNQTSLVSGLLQGAQLTNWPVFPEAKHSDYLINGKTDPYSDVDLYLGSSIVAYTKADSLGEYHFSIPLRYGFNSYQMTLRAPNGVEENEEVSVFVPNSLSRSGEVNYTVSGGTLIGKNYLYGSGVFTMGLTNWLSMRGGAEYHHLAIFGYESISKKPVPFVGLETNFSSSYALSLMYAQNAYHNATLTAYYSSGMSWLARYTGYRDNPIVNAVPFQHQADLAFNIPKFPLENASLLLTGNLAFLQNDRLYSYGAIQTTNIWKFNFLFDYRASVSIASTDTLRFNSFNHVLSSSVYFGTPQLPSVLDYLLGSTLLRFTVIYDLSNTILNSLQLGLVRPITSAGNLQLILQRDHGNIYSGQLSLFLNLPNFVANSSAYVNNQSTGFTQQFQGSVIYDSDFQRFIATQWGSGGGFSAVKTRMFIDANENNVFDQGESVITNAAAKINRIPGTAEMFDGSFHVWNLPQYVRLNATIDPQTISNPLWIPKQGAFSFITDPNVLKTINIPFQVGGTVEGSIIKLINGKPQPIPGLRVLFESISDPNFKKAIQVFSDGGFYLMGLPPGEYEAYVDEVQLQTLNASTNPVRRTFIINKTTDGDFVENLNFSLSDGATSNSNLTAGTIPPDNAKYVLQEGFYLSQAEAEETVVKLAGKPGAPFRVQKVDADAFAVLSKELSGRSDVSKTWNKMADEGLDQVRAFAPGYIEPKPRFAILLGTAQTFEEARNIVKLAQNKVNPPIIIDFDAKRKVFIVRTDLKSKREDVQRALDKVIRFPEFSGATMMVASNRLIQPFAYETIVGSYPSYSAARQIADDIQASSQQKTVVNFNEKIGEFVVALRPTYSEQDANDMLRAIINLPGCDRAKVQRVEVK